MHLDLDSVGERTRQYQCAVEFRRNVRNQIDTDEDTYRLDAEREVLDLADREVAGAWDRLTIGWLESRLAW